MTPNPIAQDVLKQAANCINGERAGDYGTAVENFERIAALWTALMPTFEDGTTFEFDVEDVANFMICVKLARLVNTPGHEDSLVDVCGYAALGRQTFVDKADQDDALYKMIESLNGQTCIGDQELDPTVTYDDEGENAAFEALTEITKPEVFEEMFDALPDEEEQDEDEVLRLPAPTEEKATETTDASDEVVDLVLLQVWDDRTLQRLVGDLVLSLHFEHDEFNTGLTCYTSMLRHLNIGVIADITTPDQRVRLGAYLQAVLLGYSVSWSEMDNLILEAFGLGEEA